jgi:hypothetical protein
MKTLNQILLTSVLAVTLNCGNVLGQPADPAQGQQRMDWGNIDPQQIQQTLQKRIMDNLRRQLAVTNDTEWTVIEERLSKVSRLRTESSLSAGMGLLGGLRANAGGGGLGGLAAGLAGIASSDPATEKLQQNVDSQAPSAQIKAALADLRESRKKKQEDLAKAQADLRSVLSTRQEAILVLAGMLD